VRRTEEEAFEGCGEEEEGDKSIESVVAVVSV
jgi:hypothetical protein